MVGDVDALQGLYLRGIGPPAAAIAVAVVVVAVEAVILPAAGIILAVGLLSAGVGVPFLAERLSRATGDRQTLERGALTAELVEVLGGAPELVLYGREEERLAAIREADRSLVRHARRDATVAGLGTGLVVLIAGLTTVAVLGCGRFRARRTAGSTGCSSPPWRCSHSHRSKRWRRSRAPRRSSGRPSPPGAACSS